MPKSKKPIKTDLKRFDAHRVTKEELEEAPPLTKEQLAKGVLEFGGKPVRLGRPLSGTSPKRLVTIRLDEDVIDHFKGQGSGWQTKVNKTLRRVTGLDRRK